MQALFSQEPWFFVTCAAVLGALIGSFLNVVIYRLPVMMEHAWRDEIAQAQEQIPEERPTFNLMTPRSRCGQCGHVITALENIPVVSWLFLRGRCSACGTAISTALPATTAKMQNAQRHNRRAKLVQLKPRLQHRTVDVATVHTKVARLPCVHVGEDFPCICRIRHEDRRKSPQQAIPIPVRRAYIISRAARGHQTQLLRIQTASGGVKKGEEQVGVQ